MATTTTTTTTTAGPVFSPLTITGAPLKSLVALKFLHYSFMLAVPN